MDCLGYNFRHRRLTWPGFGGEGREMTKTGQSCLLTRDAPARGGNARFGYWYRYFTAGAETV